MRINNLLIYALMASAAVLPQFAFGQSLEIVPKSIVTESSNALTGAQTTTPPDSLSNGTLIGAGVGFAAGFLTLAVIEAAATASGPVLDDDSVAGFIAAGVLGAAIGAGVGAVVDHVKKDVRVPWQRNGRVKMRVVVGKGRRGGSMSFRF